LAGQLDKLASTLSASADLRDRTITALELYRSKHPEQQRLMDAEGIMGLQRRGLVVPLAADELH